MYEKAGCNSAGEGGLLYCRRRRAVIVQEKAGCYSAGEGRLL